MPSNKMGLTTSDNTLAPLGGSQIAGAIDAIEPYVVCRFATTGARDTAFPASAGGRPAGTVVFVPSVGYHQTALTTDAAWTRLATKVTVAGADGYFLGSSAPAGTDAIVKAFSAVVTVDAWGGVSVPYPGGAFPNGVQTVVATPGDTVGVGGLGYVASVQSNCTLAVWYGVTMKTTGAVMPTGSMVRVNLVAMGW